MHEFIFHQFIQRLHKHLVLSRGIKAKSAILFLKCQIGLTLACYIERTQVSVFDFLGLHVSLGGKVMDQMLLEASSIQMSGL